MQFKHPEILYALLALAIPIIVHLFQLRRFKKVVFTNVQMLKTINAQTRKSSMLKKWLALLARLFLLACAIIGFAQPYKSKSGATNTKHETVIYLDNSFSMQAKNNNGSLLNEAVRDLMEHIDEDKPIYLFTNDITFGNTSLKAIKNDLIQLGYSQEQLSYGAMELKGKNAFSKNKESIKDFVIISDFQQKKESPSFENDNHINYKLVQLKPKKIENCAIDSVYITAMDTKNIELVVKVDKLGNSSETVPISLFDNETLIAKSAISEQGNVVFNIPSGTDFYGKLTIEDTGLQYDDTFYFNLNKREKIKILTINQADDGYLSRLFKNDEFEFTQANYNELNYNELQDKNLIILNELNTIPGSLANAIKPLVENGTFILTIPSNEIDLNSYNQLFEKIESSVFRASSPIQKKITNINFSHPLLADVFEKKVDNFQYPKTETSYVFAKPLGTTILAFEDTSPFLQQFGNCYTITAALNDSNSNFKNSPLIVPVLYNIAKQSLKIPRLYYTIGKENTIDITGKLQQDDILTLSLGDIKVVPLQQTYSNKVEVKTNEMPNIAGIYSVENKNEALQHLSFNFPREESRLSYLDLSIFGNTDNYASVAPALHAIKSASKVDGLWKWFVIFAVFFMIVEMLILKFLK
ncbi:MAG TPA: BatA domain-containing protein [Aquaticitalea sp.]|nr:BatA domain-containing protein [Aquaticitalea sp.]